MSIFDRIKAHKSSPDVYDPPTLDALMNVALAADELAKKVDKLDRHKPGETGGRLVLEVDILSAISAAAAFRAACGEGE